jgi:hypothetical protein
MLAKIKFMVEGQIFQTNSTSIASFVTIENFAIIGCMISIIKNFKI